MCVSKVEEGVATQPAEVRHRHDSDKGPLDDLG